MFRVARDGYHKSFALGWGPGIHGYIIQIEKDTVIEKITLRINFFEATSNTFPASNHC